MKYSPDVEKWIGLRRDSVLVELDVDGGGVLCLTGDAFMSTGASGETE